MTERIPNPGDTPPRTREHLKPWDRMLARVRDRLAGAVEAGVAFGTVAALIGLAGLLNYCPRCGQWMGAGSEGSGPKAPNPEAPPIPPRILKAISTPITEQPTITSRGSRENRLEYNRNQRHYQLKEGPSDAETRYSPPASEGHGRRVDQSQGEYDDENHGHRVLFVRGDSEEILIHERSYGEPKPPRSPNDVYVKYNDGDGSYDWS